MTNNKLRFLLKMAKKTKSYEEFFSLILKLNPEIQPNGIFYRSARTIWDIAHEVPWSKPMKQSDWEKL